MIEVTSLKDTAYLIKLNKAQILVECPLDLKPLLKYSPASLTNLSPPIEYSCGWLEEVNFAEVDLVLISNSTLVGALPYINSSFRGKVLMTEPIAQLGTCVCKELIEYDQEFRRVCPQEGNMYTEEQVKTIWNHVVSLSYNQTYSLREIDIAAVPSGHSLGSANWLINWGDLKISIISQSCKDEDRYPKPFDSSVYHSDIIVFTPQVLPVYERKPPKKLYESILETCRSLSYQSCLLVPVQSWQLLDLESHIISAATVFNLPVLCMSPAGRAFLSYAAGSPQWLHPKLTARAFTPRNCFMFEKARENGTLKVFDNLQEGFGAHLQSPSLVLLGHSSLRLGEADYVVTRLARKGGLHNLLIVDSEFGEEALKPFEDKGVMNHYIVRKECTKVELTVEEIKQGICESTAHTIVMSDKFKGTMDFKAHYITEGEKLTLPKKPNKYCIKGYCQDSGPLIGRIKFLNYKYTGYFQNRAEALKEKLSQQGYEAICKHYQSKSELSVLGGVITFKGKNLFVKAKTTEVRKALLNFLNI